MDHYSISKMADARQIVRAIYGRNERSERSGKLYIRCPVHEDRVGKEDRHPSAEVGAHGCRCWSCGGFTSTAEIIRRKRPDADPYRLMMQICDIPDDAVTGDTEVFYCDESSLRDAGYKGPAPTSFEELKTAVRSVRKSLDDVEVKYCSIDAPGIDTVIELLGEEYEYGKLVELKVEIERRRSLLEKFS